MNMYIIFPNCPCFMIDVVMKTTVNEMDKDEMIKQLHWRHENVKSGLGENSYNEIVPFPNVNTSDPDTAKKIIQFLKDGDKCIVHGNLEVTKVTGQFAFRLRGETEAWRAFNELNKNEHNGKYQLQMNHKVESLTFGEFGTFDTIKEMFGDVDNGAHTTFNMFDFMKGKVNHDLKFEAEKQEQLYFYFVKLVPHVFIDMFQYREWRSYSYSLAHNKKEAGSP